MPFPIHSLAAYPAAILLVGSPLACAGTVVVTSLPDETHALSPLASRAGTTLATGVNVAIGSFPGLTDDQVLDSAASGGFAAISSAFQTFGTPRAIGDGSEGESGTFEISATRSLSMADTSWSGQEISILISNGNDGEFLVARFKGQTFLADPDTGIEPIQTLHLADARLIVGNRNGPGKLVTSTAPAAGSFASWILSHPSLTGPGSDPGDLLPGADPDGDGRSNFLEYATGGNPGSPLDPPPCQIVKDPGTGKLWIRYARIRGVGVLAHTIQATPDLATAWRSDPGLTATDSIIESNAPGDVPYDWIRVPLARTDDASQFFRLYFESGN